MEYTPKSGQYACFQSRALPNRPVVQSSQDISDNEEDDGASTAQASAGDPAVTISKEEQERIR